MPGNLSDIHSFTLVGILNEGQNCTLDRIQVTILFMSVRIYHTDVENDLPLSYPLLAGVHSSRSLLEVYRLRLGPQLHWVDLALPPILLSLCRECESRCPFYL